MPHGPGCPLSDFRRPLPYPCPLPVCLPSHYPTADFSETPFRFLASYAVRAVASVGAYDNRSLSTSSNLGWPMICNSYRTRWTGW